MLISVIVCTHNRAAKVVRCLEALAAERESVSEWELVLVANACADDTAARARGMEGMFGGRLRVIEEPRPGLSIARNVGAEASNGRYLIYLDDDAIPLPGWLRAYAEWFGRNPDVRAGGGPILPDWTGVERPKYWHPDFEVNRARLEFEAGVDRFPEGRLPFGANMFMRRDALAELGGFDPALGMKGRSIGVAEETEWFLRVVRRGEALGYVHAAPVSHWVNPRDLTRRGLLKRAYETGVVAVRVFGVGRPPRGWLGWLRHGISALVKGRLDVREQVYLTTEFGSLWACSWWGRRSGTATAFPGGAR